MTEYTERQVDALRYLAKRGRTLHTRALEAGGYVNPYEECDTVEDTDVCVTSRLAGAIVRDLAADLVEMHLQGAIELDRWPNAALLVQHALRPRDHWTQAVTEEED